MLVSTSEILRIFVIKRDINTLKSKEQLLNIMFEWYLNDEKNYVVKTKNNKKVEGETSGHENAFDWYW